MVRTKDGYINLDLERFPRGLLVPCRKCLACQNERKKELSIRALHESKKYKNVSFLTLTYDNANCPMTSKGNYTLNKKQVSLYLKRVREQIARANKNVRPDYKYFLSGEYGEDLYRPHYHLIIMSNDLVYDDYFRESWVYGRVHYEQADSKVKSIFYTTGYVAKKIGSDSISAESEPPFCLYSKGMGLDYVNENKSRLENDKFIRFQGIKYPLPRYYKSKLNIDTEEFRLKALEDRNKQFVDIAILNMLTNPKCPKCRSKNTKLINYTIKE